MEINLPEDDFEGINPKLKKLWQEQNPNFFPFSKEASVPEIIEKKDKNQIESQRSELSEWEALNKVKEEIIDNIKPIQSIVQTIGSYYKTDNSSKPPKNRLKSKNKMTAQEMAVEMVLSGQKKIRKKNKS